MTCGAISPVVLKKAVPSGNVMFGRHDGPPSRGPVAVLVTTSHRENVADGPGRKMTLSGAPGPLPAETSSGLHGIYTTATMEWPTSTAEKGQRAAGQTTNSHHASGVAVAGVAAVDGTAGRMKPANGSMQSGRAPAMGTTMSPFRPATAADPRLPGPGQRIDLRNPDAPRGSENRQRDREQNRPDHPAVAAGDGGAIALGPREPKAARLERASVASPHEVGHPKPAAAAEAEAEARSPAANAAAVGGMISLLFQDGMTRTMRDSSSWAWKKRPATSHLVSGRSRMTMCWPRAGSVRCSMYRVGWRPSAS